MFPVLLRDFPGDLRVLQLVTLQGPVETKFRMKEGVSCRHAGFVEVQLEADLRSVDALRHGQQVVGALPVRKIFRHVVGLLHNLLALREGVDHFLVPAPREVADRRPRDLADVVHVASLFLVPQLARDTDRRAVLNDVGDDLGVGDAHPLEGQVLQQGGRVPIRRLTDRHHAQADGVYPSPVPVNVGEADGLALVVVLEGASVVQREAELVSVGRLVLQAHLEFIQLDEGLELRHYPVLQAMPMERRGLHPTFRSSEHVVRPVHLAERGVVERSLRDAGPTIHVPPRRHSQRHRRLVGLRREGKEGRDGLGPPLRRARPKFRTHPRSNIQGELLLLLALVLLLVLRFPDLGGRMVVSKVLQRPRRIPGAPRAPVQPQQRVATRRAPRRFHRLEYAAMGPRLLLLRLLQLGMIPSQTLHELPRASRKLGHSPFLGRRVLTQLTGRHVRPRIIAIFVLASLLFVHQVEVPVLVRLLPQLVEGHRLAHRQSQVKLLDF
mmetsp:Transcript_17226/g.55921  ORF Transcript_17226/g.55921 Transcript_17226/m.55921 type:complete len:495 (+) Transcript_17226:1479-2963(+)